MPRRVRRRRQRLIAALPGVGAMLLIGAVVMSVSGLVGMVYRDWWSALWFLVSALIAGGSGAVARRSQRESGSFDDTDAMTTAAVGWLALAMWGAIPFMLAANLTPEAIIGGYAGTDYESSSLLHFRDPLHAVFEAMSGWTTTGLTMSVNEPSMPHAFLMYRSLMQWIGGVGVIVLALSVLQQHGDVRGLYLYRAEGRRRQLRPSIVETARRVWRVYLFITAVLAAYLLIATLILLPDYPLADAVFDAVNHAMTGQATGGFSTLDDSIAGYGSYAMEFAHLLPMVSGAIALPVHYVALMERRPSAYLGDIQNRVLFWGIIVGCLAMSALLVGATAVADPVREGVFQLTSAFTGTGWQTSDIVRWPMRATVLILVPMLIGGAAGSTVGGIKLLRAIYLVRDSIWRVQEVFRPSSAVTVIHLGDRTMRVDRFEREAGRAAGLLFLWVIGLLASVLVMTVALGGETSLQNILFESASAQNNVGLSSEITGPDMPASVELVFIVQMWMGRLEIIPILVLIRALARRSSW